MLRFKFQVADWLKLCADPLCCARYVGARPKVHVDSGGKFQNILRKESRQIEMLYKKVSNFKLQENSLQQQQVDLISGWSAAKEGVQQQVEHGRWSTIGRAQ